MSYLENYELTTFWLKKTPHAKTLFKWSEYLITILLVHHHIFCCVIFFLVGFTLKSELFLSYSV